MVSLLWALPSDLDPAFDGDGKALTDIMPGNDQAGGMSIQLEDGKIVVVGSSNQDFVVVRYNPDGSLDRTFGMDGKVVTNIGASDEAYAVAIQDVIAYAA